MKHPKLSELLPGKPVCVVCMPYEPGTLAVKGYGTAECAACGRKVVVAPSTWATMERRTDIAWRIECLPCALPKIEASDEALNVSAEQMKELKAGLEVVR